MINLRSFTVTYVGYTNTKPARVRIHDNRHKKTVFIPYHVLGFDRVEEIAQEYLANLGILCTFVSQGKRGFLLLTSNFEIQIKQ